VKNTGQLLSRTLRLDIGPLHRMKRKEIAIIGGGPAGMMAADVIAPHHNVRIYEHGRSIGRKFLVAGQGGFNLTNSADGEELLAKYHPSDFMKGALQGFGSAELRAWLQEIGIGTYVGSSGRVFPSKGIKPVQVLQAIRDRLVECGVVFLTEHVFDGFDEQARPIMESHTGRAVLEVDHVLFALGGASWPVTGSTGIWPALFASIGIHTVPFQASNCGIQLPWPQHIIRDHAGKALKNIRCTAEGLSSLGEATITEHGLEGNAIYPIVPAFRRALSEGREAFLQLDLKPNNTVEQLLHKLNGAPSQKFALALNLDRPTMALLKAFTTKERFLSPSALAHDLACLRIPVTGLRPLGEAISTVGGINPEDLTPTFAFKRFPHLFAIGEMVDWDAPTGGYLLQGCFAMGHHVAQSILRS
jgi:uncharacterized flavoprotein (TIGR03862 family)